MTLVRRFDQHLEPHDPAARHSHYRAFLQIVLYWTFRVKTAACHWPLAKRVYSAKTWHVIFIFLLKRFWIYLLHGLDRDGAEAVFHVWVKAQ